MGSLSWHIFACEVLQSCQACQKVIVVILASWYASLSLGATAIPWCDCPPQSSMVTVWTCPWNIRRQVMSLVYCWPWDTTATAFLFDIRSLEFMRADLHSSFNTLSFGYNIELFVTGCWANLCSDLARLFMCMITSLRRILSTMYTVCILIVVKQQVQVWYF